jgi:hypothetical protein
MTVARCSNFFSVGIKGNSHGLPLINILHKINAKPVNTAGPLCRAKLTLIITRPMKLEPMRSHLEPGRVNDVVGQSFWGLGCRDAPMLILASRISATKIT